MKWFLIGFVCVVCSVTLVKGDAAGDLYKQGVDALGNEQYDVAVKAFDQIITGFPLTPNIDEIRIRDGFAYLHQGDFTNAIDRLAPETLAKAKPALRGTALYLTGLAQFSQSQKLPDTDKAGKQKMLSDSATTLTTLLDFIKASPTPDNQDYTEDAIYYRAVVQFNREDYADAEKDLLQLLQPPFSTSLKRPDYLVLLGNLYAVETNVAVAYNNDPKNKVKKTTDEIKALAQKAIDRFTQVSNDPNALVQANDANMSNAEVLSLIAQIDPNGNGYQKALEAYRLVRRKDDMVQLQQDRLNQLKQAAKVQIQNNAGGAGASMANATSRLIDRETGRLTELQKGTDPIILALLRMGECYVSMKQPDEARTVLRRLVAHAPLTPDQQQEVDFQLLYSYVLGGQTDKANRALNDYLGKHKGDPQADSISYQIAAKLMERKDYSGALDQAERSLRDFPNGTYVPQVIALKAQALTSLGRLDDASKVLKDYISAHPTSPVANQMALTKAQGEVGQGDFNGALADYKQVRDNASAGAELQSIAAAGYIQTLQSLNRYDDVISESQAFATKYPDNKALPGVMLFAALAMDKKNDPGTVAALHAVAQKYPKDDVAPFALFYVVNYYQRTTNIPALIQAADDLQKAYPTSYVFLGQTADAVSAAYLKQKKFTEAIALYQPLVAAPQRDVAASAQNKIGGIWMASAKSMGAYQSMALDVRTEAEKRLTSSEQAYLATLKNYDDQTAAVGDAFQGLADTLKMRRSWGLLTDADMEAYLGKITSDLTSPEMQARVEMAKAGLVFIYKNGDKQFPAALDRYKKAANANASMCLTRNEANQYGDLLLAGKDYPTALQVYKDLLNKATDNDSITKADGLYGLGATYLAQGDVANAKTYFSQMKALPNGAAWHPHIQDVDFGLAMANEQSSQPADNAAAMQTYASLMTAPQAALSTKAKAMLGYGRLLEKAGHAITPTAQGPTENAVHYYQEIDTLFGPAVPQQSAEGLFDAGQAYEKAGDKANALTQYAKLTDPASPYAKSAPDWIAKAAAAKAKLGP